MNKDFFKGLLVGLVAAKGVAPKNREREDAAIEKIKRQAEIDRESHKRKEEELKIARFRADRARSSATWSGPPMELVDHEVENGLWFTKGGIGFNIGNEDDAPSHTLSLFIKHVIVCYPVIDQL